MVSNFKLKPPTNADKQFVQIASKSSVKRIFNVEAKNTLSIMCWATKPGENGSPGGPCTSNITDEYLWYHIMVNVGTTQIARVARSYPKTAPEIPVHLKHFTVEIQNQVGQRFEVFFSCPRYLLSIGL